MSYIWPFAQNPNSALPQTIYWDLIIQEPYPGISFYPTNIAGSAYCEVREVDGCLWWVVNAMWNPGTLQWEQDSPCNSALPAYALEMCQDGTLKRNVAAATEAIDTPVDWVTVFESDANGLETNTPLTLTQQTQIAQQLNLTWNAGAAAVMTAREINVTDTSSDIESALDQLSVGGVVVWKVRKDGTLVVGKIPASAIVGGIVQSLVAGTGISIDPLGDDSFVIGLSHGDYVDLDNVQTVTGEKTFEGPVLLQSAESGAIGGTDGLWLANGAVFSAGEWVAQTAEASIVIINAAGFTFYSNTGLVVGNTYAPTPRFSVDSAGDVTIHGTLQVVGAATFDGNVTVDGNETVDGTLNVIGSIEQGGNSVVTALNGNFGAQTLESSDGSIVISEPDGAHIDLKVANSGPTAVGAAIMTHGAAGPASITLPDSGGTWAVKVEWMFSAGSNNNASATISLTGGAMTNTATSGAGTLSQNAPYYSAAMFVGDAVANQTLTFSLVAAGAGSPLVDQAWSITAVRTA